MKISKPDFSQKLKTLMAFFLLSLSAMAGVDKKSPLPVIERADPPFWWTGMETDTIQIVFHGKNIASYDEITMAYPCAGIDRITRVKNPNYLFVSVFIMDGCPQGSLPFQFKMKGKKKPLVFNYEIKARAGKQKRGLDPNDAIYLVFPDRFANGDPTNDALSSLLQPNVDRSGLITRHGGDLEGIRQHLDYFTELGASALWINPVLENNQPYESYHGYAATDLYRIDPRFGSNESYVSLVNDCHKKGLKVIWDVVYNHWGNENWMFKDLPDSNWVHWFPQFTRTNYRAETLMDPYASQSDKKMMTDCWFDKHMPDLNQQDPLLAKYLIQNSIWWIEYAQLDAFRIDTYAYPDQLFMKSLNEQILREYPDFFIFGETWVQGSPIQAWFPMNSPENTNYSSSLHGVTDFQLYMAITKGLNENFGWEEGLRRIELTLAHDLLYEDAYRNVTHLDNHDLSRFYSVVNEDFNKWKAGIALLLTLRGIPQIYYGTEILMSGNANPDAHVRKDFPGGWPGDKDNKFTSAGRTEKENEAYRFVQTLLNYRKNNPWFGGSKLTQFVPYDNTYVYFRSEGDNIVMCVYNLNDHSAELDLSRFAECMKGRTRGSEIISGQRVSLAQKIELAPKSVMIYELH